MTRRILVVTAICAVCATAFALAPGSSPDPQSIRDAANEVLAREIYDLERAEDRLRLDLGWLFELIGTFFRAIFEFFGALPDLLYWSIVFVLVALLLFLVWHIVYSIRQGVAMPKQQSVELDESRPAPAAELAARAYALAAQQNYVDASRLLYRAALTMLEEKRGGRVMNGLTNSEYLQTFRTPWIRENLAIFAQLINWKWYRARSFDAEDYRQCEQAFRTLEDRLSKEF